MSNPFPWKEHPAADVRAAASTFLYRKVLGQSAFRIELRAERSSGR